MTAAIVTAIIAGLIGTSFVEPGKAPAKGTRARAARPAPVVPGPVFVPVAWAPPLPPPAPTPPAGGHIMPMHIGS